MDKSIDCRGLACPKPLLAVRDFLQATPGTPAFVVTVDNDAARENVTRYCGTMGYGVTAQKEDRLWHLAATLTGEAASVTAQQAALEAACPVPGASRVCVVVTSAEFGNGSAELGSKLMKTFLATLPEFGDSLWRVIFLNGGVRLCAEGSHVLDELQKLHAGGTGILACGTCLEFFGLLEKKVLGETTNMMDVVTAMQVADKVIKI